ncbi:MAG: hypothetical protein WBR29_11355 [Gammaproteobacteria bacterium]
MAKKTASRGRAKTAKKTAPKRKRARRVAKSAKTTSPKARKASSIRAMKPIAPEAAKTSKQAQVKNELREKYVTEQGNTAFEDYFSSGSEHFGL